MKNDLHEMQQMVGGPIQALYPWEEPVAIVCNDEGGLEAFPDCFIVFKMHLAAQQIRHRFFPFL